MEERVRLSLRLGSERGLVDRRLAETTAVLNLTCGKGSRALRQAHSLPL